MTRPIRALALSHPFAVSADPSWMMGACAALLLLALCLFDSRLLNDGDTYWHLAAGHWMLSHGQVPHTDPFSFSRSGTPWQAHEWLAEVLMALAFLLGSWNGVVALYGLALGGTALLLSAWLRRFLTGPSLALALALVFACIAPNLLARPHILVLPLVVAWTAALLQAREEQRAPPAWAAGLMLLWANLHGSFVFGFLLLGGFALEALVESKPDRRWRIARDWSLFFAASVVAASLTPQGPMGLVFPFELMRMSSLGGIVEWRAMDFSRLAPFEIAMAATLFVCFTRGVKVSPIRALLLIGLLHMALQHNRHAIFAALITALVLAPAFAEAIRRSNPDEANLETKPAPGGAWLLCGALALALILARAAVPIIRADGPTTPATALDHVPAALRAQHVLNEYDFGGYLIFRNVRPYVDGRTDLYGDAFMDHYYRIARPDRAALDQTLRDAHIAWTIFSPAAPVVALMDTEPGWKRLYADPFAVIHARMPTPASSKTAGNLPRREVDVQTR
jgi:hypothetical protein